MLKIESLLEIVIHSIKEKPTMVITIVGFSFIEYLLMLHIGLNTEYYTTTY